MRRAKFYSGVITLALITLPLLTTGCTQSNSSAERSANAAQDAIGVGDEGLPEVVVTAKRSGAETIAMSDRDANGATASTRAHRP
jgi:hypothetical protein